MNCLRQLLSNFFLIVFLKSSVNLALPTLRQQLLVTLFGFDVLSAQTVHHLFPQACVRL